MRCVKHLTHAQRDGEPQRHQARLWKLLKRNLARQSAAIHQTCFWLVGLEAQQFSSFGKLPAHQHQLHPPALLIVEGSIGKKNNSHHENDCLIV